MTGSTIQTEPSLLPYVDSGKPGLHLWLTGDDPDGGKQPEVLSAIEGAGPFAAVVEGTVTAHGRPAMIDLFLLVQPDHYPVSASELVPVTNLDIERLWQSAAERVRALCQDHFAPVFPEQIDDQGRMVAWRPLFYCRHKSRYAHPLCADCGGGLTLCRDDQALQVAGLPLYSKSLSRFLYCPACRQGSEAPRFYARSVAPSDPTHLIGGGDLMEGFSRLLTRQDLADQLPCIGCDQATDCYGPETRVHQRMIPLFFYPFFMLIQPAPSLSATEFLELLAGARFDQIEQRLVRQRKPGRLHRLRQYRQRVTSGDGLLFRQMPQRFAEVLYLKLCMLTELFDLIHRCAGHLPEPVTGMSLEGLWVRLPDQTPRLPLFWNFSLQLIDAVGRPETDPVHGPLAQARNRVFLGTAWCHALLANASQDMRTIQNAIDTAPAQMQETAASEQALWREAPVFDAGNLLYQPTNEPIANHLEALWQRALALGLDLLKAGRSADQTWSDDHFRQQVDMLRQEVHTALFQETTAPATDTAPATNADDERIAAIVRDILAQWPQETTAAGEAAAAAEVPESEQAPGHPIPDDDGDFQETVILGAETTHTPEATRIRPPQVTEESDTQAPNDDLQATVIIPGAPDAANPPPMPEEMEKTVVTTGREAPPQVPDDLEATVIIKGGVRADPQSHGVPSKPATPEETPAKTAESNTGDEDDDLAQTVIMRPGPSKQSKDKP